MSDKKYSENDPERTLITLDQLSQTIEVMTSVVNRLRQHLSEQIMARREIEEFEKTRQQEEEMLNLLDDDETHSPQESAVVEVSHPDAELEEAVDEKTLH